MRIQLKQPIVIDIAKLKSSNYYKGMYGSTRITTLKNSIAQNGLMVPIIVDNRNRVISGRRRLKAFTELGVPKIPVIYMDSAA